MLIGRVACRYGDPPPRRGPPEFKPGDWACPRCQAHNFASRAACYRCQEAKV